MNKERILLSAGAGALGVALVAGVAVAGGATADRTPSTAVAVAGTAGTDRAVADLTAGRFKVPAELVPPAGNVAGSVLAAKGVQVYRCSRAVGATAPAWTFVEPVATLAGFTSRPRRLATAVHFRGPSWQSDQDGSLVEGKAKANSPVAGSIPQLLVEAVRTQGTGVFGRVSFIQRLATSGGVAPGGSCTEGTVTAVPYRAVYRFFVPAA